MGRGGEQKESDGVVPFDGPGEGLTEPVDGLAVDVREDDRQREDTNSDSLDTDPLELVERLPEPDTDVGQVPRRINVPCRSRILGAGADPVGPGSR